VTNPKHTWDKGRLLLNGIRPALSGSKSEIINTLTSKRPVPRHRVVVNMAKDKSRDPRFLPRTGKLQTTHYHGNYSFLPEMHENELGELKASLSRAKKMMVNSPRELRAEREAEVKRLELAFKRTESIVQREHREKLERDALETVAREEKQKRKAGKGDWWMKDSEKKAMLLRARYDALAASGKPGVVKKAIEKKQRKIAQKEKRSRPFRPDRKRRDNPPSHESRPRKRTKVD